MNEPFIFMPMMVASRLGKGVSSLYHLARPFHSFLEMQVATSSRLLDVLQLRYAIQDIYS